MIIKCRQEEVLSIKKHSTYGQNNHRLTLIIYYLLFQNEATEVKPTQTDTQRKAQPDKQRANYPHLPRLLAHQPARALPHFPFIRQAYSSHSTRPQLSTFSWQKLRHRRPT